MLTLFKSNGDIVSLSYSPIIQEYVSRCENDTAVESGNKVRYESLCIFIHTNLREYIEHDYI